MSDKALDSTPASTTWQEKWIGRTYEPLLVYFAVFSITTLLINSFLMSRLAIHQQRSRQALKLRPNERESIIAALDSKVLCIVKKLNYVSHAYILHTLILSIVDTKLVLSDLMPAIAEGWNPLNLDLSSHGVFFLIIIVSIIGFAVVFVCQLYRWIGSIVSLQVAALGYAIRRSTSRGQLASGHTESTDSRISEARIIVQHISTIWAAISSATAAWLPTTGIDLNAVLGLCYLLLYLIILRSALSWFMISFDVIHGLCLEPLTADVHQIFAIEASGAVAAASTLPTGDAKKDITDVV